MKRVYFSFSLIVVLLASMFIVPAYAQNGTSTPNWNFNCSDGQFVEIVGSGTQVPGAPPTILNISNIGNVDSIVTEVVFKGAPLNLPTSATIMSSAAQVVTNSTQIILPNFGSSEIAGVFRTTMLPASQLQASVAPPSAGSYTWAFIAYVYRHGSGKASTGVYSSAVALTTTYTITVPIPVTVGTKDVSVCAILSELDADPLRVVLLDLSAGGISIQDTLNAPNLGTSLNISNYNLINVPGSTSSITLTYTSPVSLPGGLFGDSFIPAINVTVDNCPCNITLSALPSNVSCNGGSDGAVNLTVTGGTPPLNYIWSNGATTEDLTNVSAGIYSVTVFDANQCTASATSLIVTEPSAVNAAVISSTNVTINGGSDGTATAMGSGGTAPYTYLWSNNQTNATATGLSAITYTVTATDANGCTDTDNVTITQPDPLIINTTHTDLLCNGASTGTASVTSVTGGVSPYTYLWNTSATSTIITGLSVGHYTVTVTDANGATKSSIETVVGPQNPLSATAIVIDENCFGGLNGSIDLTPAGGTPAYTYVWSSGETTQDLIAIAGGTYTVTITDTNGCTLIHTETLAEPTPFIASETHINVLCNGDTTGSIDLTVNGGTTPYSYFWSNGKTTEDIINLAAGPYTVFVTDASLATGCTAQLTVTITEPTAVTANATSTDVLCFGDQTGTASATSSGGTGAHTYMWSTGETTQNIAGLGAGTYTVTATDANGCTESASTTISQPQSAVSVSITGSTNVTINAGSDGTATAASSGGTSPYTMVWSNGDTGANASNLSAGVYTVTTTDEHGCTATATVLITEPTTLNIETTHTDILCHGDSTGTASVTSVTGGVAPYTYLWNTNATTSTISNLVAGTYTVTVTDMNGATAIAMETVLQPLAALSATAVVINENCFGSNNGSIDLTPAGGTPGYTYSWSTGETTQDLASIPGGTYTVTITDANGCTLIHTETLTEPDPFTASETHVDILCNGDATGSIDVTVSGGTTPYVYAWSNGMTTQDLSNLSAGTYTLFVSDASLAAGCTSQLTVTITEPTAVTANATSTDVLCFGDQTGTASATSSGGTGVHTYMWSTGETTQNITGLGAGTYTVTATDANGCTDIASTTVSQPQSAVAVNITASTNVSINGGSDGTATAASSGGTSPYTMVWSNGDTGANASNLSAGVYTVTTTDSNGCTATTTVLITEPTPLNIETTHTDILCYGDSTGTASVTSVTGGVSPYSYLWNTNAITSTISNLVAGTYTVTVTDMNGATAIAMETVLQPLAALSATAVVIDENCFGGNNGSIDLTPAGGTPGYTYLWSTGDTTQDLTNIPAATYTVIITDANSCTLIHTETLTEPSLLTCEAIVSSNVSCNNGNDGSASAQGFGGTSPYTYLWSNGDTTAIVTGLAAGTYTATVTDANNCTTTCEVTITQPGFLFCITNVISNVSCNGGNDGAASVFALQGTPPYTFDWGTANPNALSAGTYIVNVTDTNGCASACQVTITEPPALTCTTSKTNVLCYGDSSGTATVSVSGGTQVVVQAYFNDFPFSPGGGLAGWTSGGVGSSWAIGGAGLTVGNGPFGYGANQLSYVESPSIDLSGVVTSTVKFNTQVGSEAGVDGTQLQSSIDGGVSWQQVGSLASGGTNWYNDASIDAMNLANPIISTQEGWSGNFPPAMASHDISALVGQSDVRFRFVFASDSVNSGGPGFSCDNFEVFGLTTATSGYTYSWNTNPAQTTATATNLPNGIYTVTVTDANQCTSTCTARITQPARLAAMCTSTNLTCWMSGDGAIDVTTWGGTAPYTYMWNDGTTTEDRTGLAKGQYLLTITDANGCSIVKLKYITMPRRIQRSRVITHASCFGGSDGAIDVSVWNGIPPYTFLWNDGATTEDRTGLSRGNYIVTITDANGCTRSTSGWVLHPSRLRCNIANEGNVTCFGGSDGAASVSATGGTAPYTFDWGAADPNALAAGTYTVTVTDANQCQSSCTVTITEPLELTCSIAGQVNVDCNGGNNGSASVSAAGGTGTYTYYWNTNPVQTTATATGLSAGTYTVTVKDQNGSILACVTTCTVTITESDSLISTAIVINENCFGGNNGSIDLTVSGGTPVYTYAWSTGATTQDLTAIPGGTYTVTITDANGCSLIHIETLTEPDPFIATETHVDILCNGDSTGSIDLTVSGGATPYAYFWSNGMTTQDISNIAAGPYTVFVTDASLATGCTAQLTVTITEPTLLTCTIVKTSDVSCNGATDGSATISAAGGTAPYNFNWGSANPNALAAGTYTVTVTDANQCQSTCSVTITEPVPLTCTIVKTSDVLCNGATDGSATISAAGGTAPYNFNWGSANPNALAAGTYTVTVTDANQCQSTCSVTITEPTPLTCTIVKTSDASCNGGMDGSATISAAGGTAPYNFDWGTADPDSLAAGTYTVTVTDANQCQSTCSVTISQPSTLACQITSQTNVSCNGGSTGSATVAASGGTLPYTYAWNTNPVQTTATATGLSAGTYTVMVKDQNGSSSACATTCTVTITEPDSLIASAIVVNENCFGGNNGSIDLTVSGGTPVYSYAWSTGDTTQDLTAIPGGTYTVTITDANGCSIILTKTLTQPALFTASETHINVLCNGDSTGSIDLTIAGGTPPYAYFWSNGMTTQDISNLAAGLYTVFVTDASLATGCTAQLTVTITEPAVLSVNAIPTDATCYGIGDGYINITVNGGTPAYTYVWSNGETTMDVIGLMAGTYSVIVTDANGCSETASATVNQPDSIQLSATFTEPLCNGDQTGTIDLTVVGGVGPFQYVWSNQQGIQDPGAVLAGTYTVTVTDLHSGSSCSATLEVTVTEPDPIVITLNPQNISCLGILDGAIDATVNGGTGAYTYAWSTGSTNEDLTGLDVGTYTLIVTDANGCIGSATTTLIADQAGCACVGDLVWVDANGNGIQDSNETGYPGLIVQLYTCDTVGTFPTPGTGTLVGTDTTDANGEYLFCDLPAGNYTVVFGNAPAGFIYTTPNAGTNDSLDSDAMMNGGKECFYLPPGDTNLTCDAGLLELASIGDFVWNDLNMDGIQDPNEPGVPGIAVCLYDSLGIEIGNDTTDANGFYSFVDLVPGDYNICIKTASLPFGYTYSPQDVGADSLDSDVDATGCMMVTTLDPGENDLTWDAGIFEQTGCIGDLVWVDANGNGIQDSNESGYPGLVVQLYTCDTVGTFPTPGTGTLVGTDTTDANGEYLFCDLPAGNYTVVFGNAPAGFIYTTPNAGTNDSLDSDVMMNGGKECFYLPPGDTNLTCDAGLLELASIGDFVWEDLNNDGIQDPNELGVPGIAVCLYDSLGIEIANDTTDANGFYLFENLVPGDYQVCVKTASLPFGYIFSPQNATADSLDSDVDATGCMMVTTLDPGENDLTWDAGIYQNLGCIGDFVWEDLDGDGIQDAGEPGYQGLVVSVYTCDTTGTFPTPGSGTLVGTDTTDANGLYLVCDLPSGDYYVVFDNAPAGFMYSPANAGTNDSLDSDAMMNGGTMCINLPPGDTIPTIDLGITPLASIGDFVWNDVNMDGIQDSNEVGVPGIVVYLQDCQGNTIATDTTDASGNYLFDNLAPGDYKLTFDPNSLPTDYVFTLLTQGGDPSLDSDANSAMGGMTMCTTLDPGENDLTWDAGIYECDIMITAIPTPITCFGDATGSIDVTASNGIAPYTYLWNDGNTNEDRTGLVAGTYTVTVFDDNGCSSGSGTTVIITEPTELLAMATSTDISCYGANDGTAMAFAGGGTPNYSYEWSTGALTQSIINLGPGIYTVTVTDANNCTATATTLIIEPTPFTCNLNTLIHISCFGASDGILAVNGVGGTPGYSYLWSTGATTMSISNLGPGNYSVTVTDANNCVSTCAATILQPNPLTCSATPVTHVNCNGGNDGAASVTAAGGSAPYNFVWSNGQTGMNASGLSAAIYTITVTDNNNCTGTCTVEITEPDPVSCSILNTGNVNCNGGNDGSATVQGAGGTAPYTYDWGGADPNALAAGTYTVTVTDANGCTNTCDVTITEPTPVTCTTSVLSNVSCNGGNDGSATVQGAGGTPPYTYDWGGADPNALAAGTYTVTVTDANGCTNTCDVTITEPIPVTCTTSVLSNVSCNGGNDGSATVQGAGGTSPYTYNWGGADPNALAAGTYTVTVTDANNCSSTCTVLITEPDPLTCTATGDSVVCGATDGTVSVSANGGTPNYSYLWSNGATTTTVNNLGSGIYTVVVTDANGCITTCSAEIIDLPGPTITVCPDQEVGFMPPSCDCDGKIIEMVVIYDGPAGASVNVGPSSTSNTTSWSNVQPGDTLIANLGNIGNDWYWIVNGVQDANIHASCSDDILDNVNSTKSDFGSLGSYPNPDQNNNAGTFLVIGHTDDKGNVCPAGGVGGVLGGAIANINIDNVSGGTAPFTYLWSNGATTMNQVVNIGANTTYTVTVTDANGCTATSEHTVTLVNILCSDGKVKMCDNGSAKCEDKKNVAGKLLDGYTLGPCGYDFSQPNSCGSFVQFCPCEGGIQAMGVIYNGTSGATVNFYDGSVSASNLVQSYTNVQTGDSLLFQGTGKFSSGSNFTINGGPAIEIHLSCSQPVQGETFGGVLYVYGTLDDQGNCCNLECLPPPPVCACDGKIVTMAVIYDGPTNATVTVGPNSSGSNPQIWTNVQPGDTLTAALGDIGNDWYWAVNGTVDGNIHASCSDDILLNVNSSKSDFGSLGNYPNPDQNNNDGTFLVIGHVDDKGNLCGDVGNYTPPPAPCACSGKIVEMTVIYDGPAGGSVNVGPSSSSNTTSWSNVQPGDTLIASLGNIGNDWYWIVNGSQDGNIHASCSDDILGNVNSSKSDFGSLGNYPNPDQNNNDGTFLVIGHVDENGNECSIGQNVPKYYNPVYSQELFLQAYPNPTTGQLNVTFVALNNENYNLEMMDMTGRILFNESKASQIGVNLMSYDFNYLPKGVYLLQVNMKSGTERLRVIID